MIAPGTLTVLSKSLLFGWPGRWGGGGSSRRDSFTDIRFSCSEIQGKFVFLNVDKIL